MSDDHIRPPDKVKKVRLVDDDSPNNVFENDEDFLRYKFLTMHNTKIPNEVKEAMIASKREQMVQMRKMGHVFGGTFDPFRQFGQSSDTMYSTPKPFCGNSKMTVDDDIDDITFQQPLNINYQHEKEILSNVNTNIQTMSRSDIYNILISLIFEYYEKFNAYCNVEGLVLSIQQYLDNVIDEIILQSDICWGIRQNIDLFSDEDVATKNILKKVFTPDSIDEYEKFNDVMTVQKNLIEIDDLEEINKQIQLQHELEENEKLQQRVAEEEMKIKAEKIEKRNALMSNLFQQLIRLSVYDNSIKELKEAVTEPIEKYISLDTCFVEVSSELHERLVKFIKQIRLDSTIKNEIIDSLIVTTCY